MQGVFFDGGAWQLVMQADWMTKFILLSLFLTSVLCVAIVILKFFYFRREVASLRKLVAIARESESLEEFKNMAKTFRGSLGGAFLSSGVAELEALLKRRGKKISLDDLAAFELYLDQVLDRQLAESERYLPILGTSAAVSPLIGLFGTVWGLIHAFMSISQEKSADISVVAPGIAEALLTTLAGLIVAIPAMIFFHYFSNELRKVESELAYVAERFVSVARNVVEN